MYVPVLTVVFVGCPSSGKNKKRVHGGVNMRGICTRGTKTGAHNGIKPVRQTKPCPTLKWLSWYKLSDN